MMPTRSSITFVHHRVLMVLLLIMHAIFMVSAFDWQDGGNKVQWAWGCDFYGGDIGNIQNEPGEKCGGDCVSNSRCSHFTWFNNVCYLKHFDIAATATYLNGGVCGWVNRGGPITGGRLAVLNNCPFTTWLATAPNTNIASLPDGIVQLNSGQSYSYYSIPSGGWAGRFWPKIGCDGAGNNCVFGQSSPPCPTGGCQPPADTKIEFNFAAQGSGQQSWYDISLVDGFSLPIKIVPRGINQGACIPTTCAVSLSSCPTNEIDGLGDLRVWKNNQVVACLSPCKKWNYPAPYGFNLNEFLSPGVNMCCPTPPISVPQCRTGPVVNTNYVQLIRSVCPTAYSFAYDDEGGLHACPEATSFDVTICP